MPADFVDRCIGHARDLIAGRSVILGGGNLAGSKPRVDAMRKFGAAKCLVVATGTGTGPLPTADEAETIVIDIAAPDMMSEMRAVEAVLDDPPEAVVTAIDRFDPDHDALVLLVAVGTSLAIGDRKAYGARPASWTALEDKTVGDAMFDQAGVPRPPSRVVPASFDALRDAAAELDQGAGTVWAGDAKEGFNGGGHAVRWIRDGDDGRDAAAFFAEHCDRVRVAPFVEGISCSVHGFVTDDGVAALRPVELLNLRRPTGDRLKYAGCGTFWDPPERDRAEMRAAARRLGEHLRGAVAYRGAFTLDGILGADGFVATECNPRPGAGLGYLGRALPEFPFDVVQHLAVAGDAGWLVAEELEGCLLEAGDRVRWGGGWTPITTHFDVTSTQRLVRDGFDFRVAADDERRDATVTIGPGAMGGFLRVEFSSSRTPVGESLGPLVTAAFAYTDAVHGTAIGAVAPAPSVRV
jgi:hypothetical protein